MEREVTALRIDPKRKRRIQVFLDGELAMTVAAGVADGLAVGDRLDEPALADLLQRRDEAEALAQALRLISRRPRSEKELRQAWDRRGVSPQAQAAALGRLQLAGQVDDAAFAAAWVENRGAFHPTSRRALRSELRLKGVDEETIGAALDGLDESQAAYRAAQRMANRAAGLPELDFRRRLGDQLARRGFDWETIRAAVRRVWTEQGDSPEEERG
ncbi:MAG: regulatory protein RecX [Chloroflexi bacterium]|nr:regulatory protein RecX [Chloroflexota bacterium]